MVPSGVERIQKLGSTDWGTRWKSGSPVVLGLCWGAMKRLGWVGELRPVCRRFQMPTEVVDTSFFRQREATEKTLISFWNQLDWENNIMRAGRGKHQ